MSFNILKAVKYFDVVQLRFVPKLKIIFGFKDIINKTQNIMKYTQNN